MNTRLPKLTNQRDHDFMAACRKIQLSPKARTLTCAQIAALAAASPVPSYYITFSYALRLLRKGDASLSSTAAARMADIRNKVHRLMLTRQLTDTDALSLVLAGPSKAGFYLTPQTALRLFYRLRNKKRTLHA